MLDVILLEMAQPQDATRQYRPQFLLLEPPLLHAALIDLVIQRALRELKKRIQLVKTHAELIFRIGNNADK